MIRRFPLLISIIICLMSCSTEEEKFTPIELSVKGVEFSVENMLTLTTNISQKGVEFSITGIGEYADKVCVSDITVDGRIQIVPSMPITSFSGDWGSIEQNGNTIDFTITPNQDDKSRLFEFTIGGGYWVRYLKVTQAKE